MRVDLMAAAFQNLEPDGVMYIDDMHSAEIRDAFGPPVAGTRSSQTRGQRYIIVGMQIVVPDEYKHLYIQNHERPVVKIPAEVLRQEASEVGKITKKTLLLIDEMMRIMRKANGVGLAAPQVGVLQRIIVIAPDGMKPTSLINPRVVKTEGEQIGQEGCLSIPGLYGDVKRAEYVEVEATDRRGRELTYELKGMPARVAQHEIDHLDGILFIDKVIAETLHWMPPEGMEDPDD